MIHKMSRKSLLYRKIVLLDVLIYNCYELLSDKENTSADRTQNPKTSGAKANSKKIHPP